MAKKSTSIEGSALLAGKEALGKGTDWVGRRGQLMTWYPSIGMASRDKQGKITAFCPSTEFENSAIVMMGYSNPISPMTGKCE